MKTIRYESFQRKSITAIQVSLEWKVLLSIQQVHAFCFLQDMICLSKKDNIFDIYVHILPFLKFLCFLVLEQTFAFVLDEARI